MVQGVTWERGKTWMGREYCKLDWMVLSDFPRKNDELTTAKDAYSAVIHDLE